MAKRKGKVASQTARERALVVYKRLHAAYPDARTVLNHETPLDLLVATILAAQSTDARVNVVTKTLFKKYRKPEDYLAVPKEELEEDIRTCGFFRQKARGIRNSCARIIEVFGGKVPGTMEELVSLDGVGRKTANVLLTTCFDTPGIIVDTHTRRLSGRLGFSKHTDPEKIEYDLMSLWPEEVWALYSHTLVFHGRAICFARGPKCDICPVNDLCEYPEQIKAKK